LNYRLQATEVGTRLGDDGKPTTDPNGRGDRMVLHLIAGDAAYYGLVFSTYDANDPIRKMQAQYVSSGTQVVYPFLRSTDGTTYVTGDKPSAQTEHVAAGSESTKFFVEVDHNGELTNSNRWIHRLYVLECKDHVCAWAQESYNAPRPTNATPVKQGEFVEATYQDGRWKLSAPQAYASVPARLAAVTAALAVLPTVGF